MEEIFNTIYVKGTYSEEKGKRRGTKLSIGLERNPRSYFRSRFHCLVTYEVYC